MAVPGTAVYNAGVATTPDGAVYVQHTSGATIDSPTFTGTVKGATAQLAIQSIPFIGISSGSIAANGALSGITALAVAHPKAWCYFPANAVATVAAAGWRYCTFSSTTAGTVFLDQPTSLSSPAPTSPTAVTDGKGAYTGVTGEIFLPTVAVPANALGTMGQLRVEDWYWSLSNTTGTKTMTVRFSGTGGTAIYTSGTNASVSATQIEVLCVNNGGTGTQVGIGVLEVSSAIGAFAPTLATVDTTAATSVALGINRNTATDNAVSLFCAVSMRTNGT